MPPRQRRFLSNNTSLNRYASLRYAPLFRFGVIATRSEQRRLSQFLHSHRTTLQQKLHSEFPSVPAADLNPQSLEILREARIETAIAETGSNDVMQFERQGYFVRDKDSTPDRPVFNRTIGLRDTFAKEVGAKG